MSAEADDLPDPAGRTPASRGAGPEVTPAPPAELVLTGRFDVGPEYDVHRPQGSPSWLLIWTVSGAGEVRQGRYEVTARRGGLVVLGPGVAHSYRPRTRWSFWWVHCQARPGWQTWLRPHLLGDQLYHLASVTPSIHSRIDSVFRHLHADARWSGLGSPPPPVPAGLHGVPVAVASGTAARELVHTKVEELVVLAAAASDGGKRRVGADGIDPRVARVEAIVAADPAAPHTVRSLADAVALSPSRLAHLFSEQTGRTPMQAVRDARLRHAARLLEMTDLSVASIAAAAGFVSAYHFSRVFRARFGVPPRDYRAHLAQR